jgi:hypothetical protein
MNTHTTNPMEFREFHTDPDLNTLYQIAQDSPELDRVLNNIKRHKSRGQYDRDKSLHSIYRYVVEPAAIEISSDSDVRWWKRFPRDVRREVADMVLKSWEREVL